MGPKLEVPLKSELKFTRPTIMERVYTAHIIIFFNPENGVEIYKNKFSVAGGKVSTSILINIFVKLLVHNIFEKRMKLFKVAMEIRLKKAIKKRFLAFCYETVPFAGGAIGYPIQMIYSEYETDHELGRFLLDEAFYPIEKRVPAVKKLKKVIFKKIYKDPLYTNDYGTNKNNRDKRIK